MFVSSRILHYHLFPFIILILYPISSSTSSLLSPLESSFSYILAQDAPSSNTNLDTPSARIADTPSNSASPSQSNTASPATQSPPDFVDSSPSIPPMAIPVPIKPTNQHSMQTRAKSGYAQPRL